MNISALRCGFPLAKIAALLLLLVILPINAASILLENVTLIDGKSDELLRDQFILIENDRIAKIGQQPFSISDKTIKRLDYSGYYVLPGLLDTHVHLATDPSGNDNITLTQKRLSLLALNGVIGVRDMAGDVRQLSYLSRQAGLDEIVSPDIFYSALMAGPVFFDDPRTKASSKGYPSALAPWMRGVSPSDNIDLLVAAAKGSGATGIKLYADLSGELVVKIIASAKEQKMPVWSHAAVIPAMPSDAVNAGVNSVSHATLLAWESSELKPAVGKNRYDETLIDVSNPNFKTLINSMLANKVFLEPTLTVFRDTERKNIFKNGVEATKAAYLAGVSFIVGTDVHIDIENFTHLPLIDEMVALVNLVGMSPMEAIKAATINPAVLLGIDHRIGTIEVGKVASLVVVGDNPLDDLRHLTSVVAVFKNGKQLK
jgi:imidazolonepropionase-like amidohydrolase